MASQKLPLLYQYNVCPFCWKVRALLSYKKISYETIEVHPLNKKEISFSKDYRKVPIFIDSEGNQINDSTTIMKYIDEKYPTVPVFEKDAARKVIEDQWLLWADQKLVRALPPLIYRNLSDSIQAFDYISKVEKFGWLQKQLIKYSGAMVMTLVAKKSAKSQGIQNPEEHLKKCLQEWADALDKQPFLGGAKPNGADLAILGILKSIETLPAFERIRENKNVREWFYRCDEVALKAA